MDGLVGHLLSVVDSAENLVSLRIIGMYGEYLAKACGRIIHTALLEKSIGLACVGRKKANAEEEEKQDHQPNVGRGFREHV
jgi:hypothetical protein